jgi:autotransporter-associated beta strand protein
MKRILTPLLALGTAGLLQAQTLYWGGGTTNIGNGTPIPSTNSGLTGNWTDTLQNWSNHPTTTVYGQWSNGAFANLGYFADTNTSGNAPLTVVGNKTVSGMFANLTAAWGFNRLFQLNGSANGTTLTLTGPSAIFLVAGTSNTNGIQIGGNNAGGTQLSLGASSTTLVKDGAGTLTLGNSGTFVSSDAFTGNVLVRSGAFTINGGASLAGVTTFDIAGYRPSVGNTNANGNQAFTAPTLVINMAGNSNRINDNAAINLSNRGTLTLSAGGNGIEDIGSLNINGAGFINNSGGTINSGQIVRFGTLSRGTDGRGTIVMAVDNNDVLRQNIRITNNGTIPMDTLLPWLSTNRGEWLMIDSTGGNNTLTRIASTTANLTASTWNTTYNGTSNVRINGVMTGSLTGNLTLNSLSFLGTGSNSTLNLGGNTLTLNAGALGLSPNGNFAYTISNGTIQTPGSTPLYINTGSTTSSRLVLDTVLAGTMDIYVTGMTGTTFGPDTAGNATANSYTGTVYVQSGTLTLNKDTAVTGDVVVASGGGLALGRNNALASASNVTLGRDALFYTANTNPTLAGTVTLNGGQWLLNSTSTGINLTNAGTGLVFNGGSITHTSSAAGLINLLTNVSYAASSDQQAVVQRIGTGAFTLNLNTGNNAGNAERIFNIADSTTLAADKAEMLIDTVIANGGSGSTTGSIRKTGTGTLQLTGANTYTGGTIIDGGTLQLSVISANAQTVTATFSNGGVEGDILTFNAPITGTMAVGQNATGTNIQGDRRIARILNDYQVILNGTAGTAGNQTQSVTLGAVSRMGSLVSDVTINSTGTLLIDANVTANNGVIVNTGGTFRNNGIYNGTLTVNTGGTVAGSGNFTSAVTIVSGANLAPGNSPGLATFTSGLTLNTGSNFNFELIGNTSSGRGTNFDAVDVTGGTFTLQSGVNFNITLNGTGSTVDFTNAFWTNNQSWLVFSNTNAPSIADTINIFNLGTVSVDSQGGIYTNYGSFSFSQSGNDIYLNWAPIPEPSTGILLAVGVAALWWLRRHRSSRPC